MGEMCAYSIQTCWSIQHILDSDNYQIFNNREGDGLEKVPVGNLYYYSERVTRVLSFTGLSLLDNL